MIYLSSFLFSKEMVRNLNIYPYNVFAEKAEKLLLFHPITILYGNNASGKSTMLNIMANKLQMEGLPLVDALFSEVNPIPVKTAMNLMGMHVGPLRAPLCEMGQENKAKLVAAMKEYGLL